MMFVIEEIEYLHTANNYAIIEVETDEEPSLSGWVQYQAPCGPIGLTRSARVGVGAFHTRAEASAERVRRLEILRDYHHNKITDLTVAICAEEGRRPRMKLPSDLTPPKA